MLKVVFLLGECSLERVCAFFGHRNVFESIDRELELRIEKLITEKNVTIFWVGGYGEFDNKAANAVQKLKEKYSNISLILIAAYVPQLNAYGYLPFDGFDYPPEVESAPKRFAITRRNKYMAENCDFVVSYIRQNYGGAFTAVELAKRKKKIIINVESSDVLPQK